MPCPIGVCDKWHLASERCGQDTPDGLKLKARLELARAALKASLAIMPPEPPAPPLAVVQAVEQETSKNSKNLVAKGKGRPPGPKPWRERKAEHWRAYMRGYMRARRAKDGGE